MSSSLVEIGPVFPSRYYLQGRPYGRFRRFPQSGFEDSGTSEVTYSQKEGTLRDEADVVVVGGGPAGIAAALAARQKGFTVTVVDYACPPIDKTCGEGLMPDSLAALQKLGVEIDPLQTSRFRGIRFLGSDVSVEADFPSGAGFGIRRTTLHRAMVDQADDAGVTMLWGTRVTGISAGKVELGARQIRCRWIIGADGEKSYVRRWAGLDARRVEERRFAYRRHYRVGLWTEYMELHWGTACQIYVTPVGPEQVCVALISRDPHLRIDDALPQFPELARRLRCASHATVEQGGISSSRKLRAVYRDHVALIGDASGSVDAITGEGLCLAFRQALSLAAALEAGSLADYDVEHRRINRRPALMAHLLLMLANRAGLRRRALAAMASRPDLFGNLLATHVGTLPLMYCLATGIALGYQMLMV